MKKFKPGKTVTIVPRSGHTFMTYPAEFLGWITDKNGKQLAKIRAQREGAPVKYVHPESVVRDVG